MPTSGMPCLYYYPVTAGPNATLTTIDFNPVRLSDVLEEVTPERYDAQSHGGARVTSIWGSRMRVTIRAERWIGHNNTTNAALRRSLETLERHLDHGGTVGFSSDHARSVCVSKSTTTPRGSVNHGHTGNMFSTWSSAAALSAADEVWFETGFPSYIRESNVLTSYSASSLTTSATQETALTGGEPAWIRWRYFWPTLYKPADKAGTPCLRHELGQRIFTLELDLEFDYSTLGSLMGSSSGATGKPTLTTTIAAGGGYTLDGYRGREAATKRPPIITVVRGG